MQKVSVEVNSTNLDILSPSDEGHWWISVIQNCVQSYRWGHSEARLFTHLCREKHAHFLWGFERYLSQDRLQRKVKNSSLGFMTCLRKEVCRDGQRDLCMFFLFNILQYTVLYYRILYSVVCIVPCPPRAINPPDRKVLLFS